MRVTATCVPVDDEGDEIEAETATFSNVGEVDAVVRRTLTDVQAWAQDLISEAIYPECNIKVEIVE